MENLKLSLNGQQLIELYRKMAVEGFNRTDGKYESEAYNKFQLIKFKDLILPYFEKYSIKTVLDYGSGGSDWEKAGFDQNNNDSAKDFFSLETISIYEPARGIDQRKKSDCVVCCDVLEHIFILDVPTVLRDICSYAKGLVVLNIACYEAHALLPNGENAHISIRDPMWWKGTLDTISIDFPSVNILLLCTTDFYTVQIFERWKANDWETSTNFRVDVSVPEKSQISEPDPLAFMKKKYGL